MKINPFEIGKLIKNAVKNADKYQSRIDYLKSNPLSVSVGNVTAIFDIEKNRISNILSEDINKENLENIKQAVNQVFDKADSIWEEFEK